MKTASLPPASWAGLLDAILEDDGRRAAKLLQAEPQLAASLALKARLFESKILHWLYAGDTALHLAAAGHRAKIAQILLDAGADPNAARNHRRGAPLHYAADGSPGSLLWSAGRQVETIRCLLDAGARIDAKDKNGATPLHRAVRTRCAAAAQCLLDSGADPRLRNNSGSTPFHLAVQNTGRGGSGAEAAKAGQKEIIRLFLAAGASPALRDGSGKSILDCAVSGWVRELLGSR